MEDLTVEQIKILNIIEGTFKALQDVSRQKKILTTEDIYKKLQSIYPSELYETYDVYQVLRYLRIDGVASATSTKYFWLLEEI